MVMRRSRYLGITRPLIRGQPRGWVAQPRRANVWKCGFQTQIAAARWLAKKLRVRLAALRRPELASGRRVHTEEFGISCFRGVVPHGRRWEARAHGRRLGTFKSQAAAAQVAARALRTSVKSLRKPMSAKRARPIFKAAYQVFKQYVPGDLQHTRLQEHQCQHIFKQEIACGLSRVTLGVRLLRRGASKVGRDLGRAVGV